MTPLTVGFIGIGVLFILLLSRMPIGLVMALVGFTGFAYLKGLEPALGLLRIVPYRTFADYGLSVIPLFILMGSFCYFAGLSTEQTSDILGISPRTVKRYWAYARAWLLCEIE